MLFLLYFTLGPDLVVAVFGFVVVVVVVAGLLINASMMASFCLMMFCNSAIVVSCRASNIVLFWFVFAKLFGGQGQFEEQTYLLSTFAAPLMVVTGALSIFPILGPCVAFFVWIYQIVLTYFSLKVAHDLTPGRAIGVLLAPIVIMFFCFCCFGISMAGIIAAASSSGGF